MVVAIKDSIIWAKSKDSVLIGSRMVKFTRDSGKMGNNMERDKLSSLMVLLRRVSGTKAKNHLDIIHFLSPFYSCFLSIFFGF